MPYTKYNISNYTIWKKPIFLVFLESRLENGKHFSFNLLYEYLHSISTLSRFFVKIDKKVHSYLIPDSVLLPPHIFFSSKQCIICSKYMVFQRHVLVAQTTAVKIEEKLTTIKIPWQFKRKLVFRYVISSLKDKSMQLKNVHSHLDPKISYYAKECRK